MAKPYIINALDIGTSSIKLLSVAKKQGEEGFEIIGRAEEPSFGVRKGVVTDPQRVAEIISLLVNRVEKDTGNRIEGVFASVGGGHISTLASRGLVSVSRADRKISEEDIKRVEQAAITFPLPCNKEILTTFPREYIVDGEGGIKDALGMEGVRLETEMLILCGFTPYLRNSDRTFASAGIHLLNLSPDILASSKAVLTAKEKELGVCVLDIGAGTTGMSIFEEGVLVYAAVFPVGSGHITNDIAVCLKTDIDTAEKIKIEFGGLRKIAPVEKGRKKKTTLTNDEKKITIDGEEPLVFPVKLLSDIIEARISDIFELCSKELKNINKYGQLPCGVVLTGGGAKIPGIRDLAKKELELPCRIGSPIGINAPGDDPSLATVCGLALEGAYMEEYENGGHLAKRGDGLGGRMKKILSKVFRSFIP